MEIGIAETDKEIFECYEVLSQLRPQLKREGFVELIRELMLKQSYKLVYLKNAEIKSVMGIRIGLWLHTGKYLGNLKITCVAIAALKTGSKCSFIPHKLRFFTCFCLALAASQTFFRGSLEIEDFVTIQYRAIKWIW